MCGGGGSGISEAEAAAKAKEIELAAKAKARADDVVQRRKVKAGGRASTLLAGADIAEGQRKTFLGQ